MLVELVGTGWNWLKLVGTGWNNIDALLVSHSWRLLGSLKFDASICCMMAGVGHGPLGTDVLRCVKTLASNLPQVSKLKCQ